MVVLLIGIGLFAAPHASEAGILSALFGFFTGSNIVEERFPALVKESFAESEAPALDAKDSSPMSTSSDTEETPLNVAQDHALLATLSPLGALPPDEAASSGQIFVYTVRPGDTLGGIAASFGVTVNTILWANDIANPKSVSVGTKLVILPVTGVQHQVAKGDTVASIAKRYSASADDIIQFNGLTPGEPLVVGSEIMIPNGEMTGPPSSSITTGPSAKSFASLPQYIGYYLRPVLGGRKTQGIHGYNGVDLANTCGLPIYASASGMVIIAKTSGWNGGYGEYVVIAHGNNTQTLYAHMQFVSVVAGTEVGQGDAIGAIGRTGHATGCHVHFEIRGARNPF